MSEVAANATTDMAHPKTITEGCCFPGCLSSQAAHFFSDEVALYDRQIRLWGFQAQEHIRNANILLVNIRALGNEIAKNLVLAGIGSLTIVDNAHVTEEDLGSQFLVGEEDVGKPVSSS